MGLAKLKYGLCATAWRKLAAHYRTTYASADYQAYAQV